MRTGPHPPAPRHPDSEAPLALVLALNILWFCAAAAGCGAPGDPTPRRPKVPVAVTDLAGHQAGEAVVLTFSLPKTSTDGDPLAEPPVIEIFRGSQIGTAGSQVPPQLVYTIPGGSVDTYTVDGHIRFPDPLRPEDVSAGGDTQFVYLVRTRVSGKRASADSNTVAVRVFAAPEPISGVRAEVTQTAVDLSWSPPERTTTGARLERLAGYKIYRAELEPGSAVSNELSKAKLKSPLELLGPSATSSFRDTRFEFGRTYVYSVRSIVQSGSDSAESLDSEPVMVTPQDTFPPAAPKGLVAVVVPAASDLPARVELSWGISSESDLAGYRVYRSEQMGTVGERISRELLPSPTFRDISVQPGHHYTYRVTAVDQAGNESSPSDPASVDVAPGAQKGAALGSAVALTGELDSMMAWPSR